MRSTLSDGPIPKNASLGLESWVEKRDADWDRHLLCVPTIRTRDLLSHFNAGFIVSNVISQLERISRWHHADKF